VKGEKKVKIKRDTVVKPLFSEGLIKKHEKFWRLTLLNSFLNFIKENNGVKVEEEAFECNNSCYVIERFLCIVDDIETYSIGNYDIDVVFSQIGEGLTANEGLLGAELLPIASTFTGDFVCLDFRTDQNTPSVCIWSH